MNETQQMDGELIERGVQITETVLREIDRLVQRDLKRVRKQLRELRRSVKLGKPTEYVARFGAARRISDSGKNELTTPRLAVELADNVLSDYYQGVLNIDVWPLLCLANGLNTDSLESHICMLCHSGSIELGAKFERKLCEEAGVPYQRVVVTRCLPGISLPENETSRAG